MSFSLVHSRAAAGIQALPITIETDLASGLPALSIVGLPEAAVRESKDRVRSAIVNSHFEFPIRHITINLAPADLPKQGGRFDLPIALGILAASQQIPAKALADYEFAGEVALSGELRPISGVLPFAIATRKAGRKLIVPRANADEATISGDVEVFAVDNILQVCQHLSGREVLSPHKTNIIAKAPDTVYDLKDVRGQQHAKRALEVAAAGGHSLLMCGPPGTGKTMLANRLSGLLPPMTDDEALELAAINSICGKVFDPSKWRERPFRAPHHTASGAALVGGGRPPRPGEISLSHHGVLFLDELPEFSRHVLETLREPLESGVISIARAARTEEFPARFQLIAAMNPCPCGYYTDPNGNCRCTADAIERYRGRLSGPLLDRIDLHIEVPAIKLNFLSKQNDEPVESSANVQTRVMQARTRQIQRAGKPNAQLNNQDIKTHCRLLDPDAAYLEKTLERLQISARVFHRLLRIARTLADLAGSDIIQRNHLSEALNFCRK